MSESSKSQSLGERRRRYLLLFCRSPPTEVHVRSIECHATVGGKAGRRRRKCITGNQYGYASPPSGYLSNSLVDRGEPKTPEEINPMPHEIIYSATLAPVQGRSLRLRVLRMNFEGGTSTQKNASSNAF